MGLGWLLLTIGFASEPTEFLIDTDTPDALCPELSMTREAVRRRVGQLEVEGGGTWRGRYSNVHDPDGRRGDYVRLVIFDPTGKEQSARDLPLQGESCATMAQAIALVVDGFFRDLGHSTQRDAPGALPAAVRTSRHATDAHSTAQTGDFESKTVARRTPTSRSGITHGPIVGGAYDAVLSSAAASLGWFVAGTGAWLIDLRVEVPSSKVHETRHGVDANLYALPMRLKLNYAPQWSKRLRPFAGPELLFSPERGAADGLDRGRNGWRATLGLGACLGAAVWLSPTWAIAGSFSADFALLQSRRFLLEDEPVFELRRARLAGALELWAAIFR